MTRTDSTDAGSRGEAASTRRLAEQQLRLYEGVRRVVQAFSRTASSAFNLPAGLTVCCHEAPAALQVGAVSAWVHDRRSHDLVLTASSRTDGRGRGHAPAGRLRRDAVRRAAGRTPGRPWPATGPTRWRFRCAAAGERSACWCSKTSNLAARPTPTSWPASRNSAASCRRRSRTCCSSTTCSARGANSRRRSIRSRTSSRSATRTCDSSTPTGRSPRGCPPRARPHGRSPAGRSPGPRCGALARVVGHVRTAARGRERDRANWTIRSWAAASR